MAEKKTSRVTIWLPESLEIDLMRMAAMEDRKLSEFITHVLLSYAYGQVRCECPKRNVAMGGDSLHD